MGQHYTEIDRSPGGGWYACCVDCGQETEGGMTQAAAELAAARHSITTSPLSTIIASPTGR